MVGREKNCGVGRFKERKVRGGKKSSVGTWDTADDGEENGGLCERIIAAGRTGRLNKGGGE